MRKILIKESDVHRLVKDSDLLPSFIFKKAMSHETSLGDNGALPPMGNATSEYILLKARMRDVNKLLSEFGYGNLTVDELRDTLSKLMRECVDAERPIRDYLQKLCVNAVNKLFAIPQESMNIECTLVDKVSPHGKIRVTQDEDVEYTFNDVDDMVLSDKAILKRRVIDSLVQGGAYTLSNVHENYYRELSRLNNDLPRLYNRINVINDYLTFATKEKMSEDNPMQGSYVEVKLGRSDEKVTLTAQGLIFPLLYRETIKGMFEVFASHGLPNDPKKAMYIIKKADFLLAEPWDIRLGIPMWEKIFSRIDDTNIIPYVFMELVTLPIEDFNKAMQELILGSRRGHFILDELLDKAEENKSYREFENRMDVEDLTKTIMADSYFSTADLDGLTLDGDDDDQDMIEDEVQL